MMFLDTSRVLCNAQNGPMLVRIAAQTKFAQLVSEAEIAHTSAVLCSSASAALILSAQKTEKASLISEAGLYLCRRRLELVLSEAEGLPHTFHTLSRAAAIAHAGIEMFHGPQ